MLANAQTDVLFTLVAAVSAGTVLTAIARRADFSAIVLLLLGGIALGPQGAGIVKPESLEYGLQPFVSFAVALILFEGGLTLNVDGYRAASGTIVRLLTVGVMTTWCATAVALWLLLGLPFDLSLVGGSLVIVTGPTVITPLLKRIRLQQPLHDILHWEGVLIDPIGVFLAVLCLEWISGMQGHSAVLNFMLRVLTGLACGVVGGLLLSWWIRQRLFSEDLVDLVPVAFAAAIFGIAEAIKGESGLLAATTAGLVLGLSRPPELKSIRRFKAAISDLLIGMLFIVLAARLVPRQFIDFGATGLLTVGVVVFAVRALNIALSTFGESLTGKQKAFLAWVAPRGIVAASMSSLFAIRLEQAQVPRARSIETFTYLVIMLTVVLQGLTAGWLARRLGLRRPDATGWLVVGAHLFGRKVAEFISREAGVPVILCDLNSQQVEAAREAGLKAVAADARDVSMLEEQSDVQATGNLLALTDNEDLNSLLCQRWVEVFGRSHVFGWHSKPASDGADRQLAGTAVWDWLPKPTIVSGDLERQMLCLNEAPLPAADVEMPADTLLWAARNGAVLDPVVGKTPKPRGPATALTFERRGSHLLGAIHRELFLRTDCDSMEQLLAMMAERLVSQVPRLPAGQIMAELLGREKAFPSIIGRGVAIPHTYSKSVHTRACAIAVIPNGFAHPASDDEPVRLVFLIVGPPGDPEGHLALIAEIARLASRDHVREQLLHAGSYDDVVDIVRTAGENAL